MDELLNVCVSDPIDFDDLIFKYWLEGKTVDKALESKLEPYKFVAPMRGSSATPQRYYLNTSEDNDGRIDSQLIDLLRYDISDQYRTFEILEHYISQPSLLSKQNMLQVPPCTQSWIIDKYYQLDDAIIREILYKKMSKTRKDLDEISEYTKFPLRRVTRQIDNLRRITSALEDKQCNILQFIEKQYLLPIPVARKYACLVYLINGKFNIISKKRMQRVPCMKLELCGAITMACLIPDKATFYHYWRYDDFSQTEEAVSSTRSPSPPMDCVEDTSYWYCVWQLVSRAESLDPDKELLRSLQQIRAHLSGDVLDSACSHVRAALLGNGIGVTSSISAPPPSPMSSPSIGPAMGVVRKLEAGGGHLIRTVLKNVIMLGSNLSQSREFRDLFEDIMTKIGEVLEDAGLSVQESCVFLRCCGSALSALEGSRVSTRLPDMKKEWQRFIHCCRLCLMQLFNTV